MKNSLLRTFFASGLQAISVQILGIIFFIVLSLYLPKSDFGTISWANATSVFITTLLSFGLDQVVVRRIASSRISDWAAAAYLIHALIGSIITLLILFLVIHFFDAGAADKYAYLEWFFIAQALSYIALPLKQFLNARQNFTPYAVISFFSNVIKILLAIYFVLDKTISISFVAGIMIFCGILEFLALLFYVRRKENLKLRFKKSAYFKILKESVPQYVSVLFDSGLSRADWILLGIMSTTAVTADYSFAYRAFEMCRLPIVVVAPIILNVFARLLVANNHLDTDKKQQVSSIYSMELFFSTLIPLCLNILWSPVVTAVFKGKYGAVNATQFMLLSFCLPFMFIINLFWTLSFSAKKYKQISFITFFTAIFNLLLNIILIHYYEATGAAISFLMTTLLQTGLHYRLVRKYVMHFSILKPLMFFGIAIAAYYGATFLVAGVGLQLLFAIIIYIIFCVSTKAINMAHLQTLKFLLKK